MVLNRAKSGRYKCQELAMKVKFVCVMNNMYKFVSNPLNLINSSNKMILYLLCSTHGTPQTVTVINTDERLGSRNETPREAFNDLKYLPLL